MRFNGKLLKWLLVIDVILIFLYNQGLTGEGNENSAFWKDWLYLLTLAFSVGTVFYAFFTRCPNPECKAPQVFRGLSAFDIRLPSTHCYKCGTPLKKLGETETKGH